MLLAVVANIDTGFDLLVDDPSQCRLANLVELSQIDRLTTGAAHIKPCERMIPGKDAAPPASGDGAVPLTFEDWGRIQSSTSLIAALWYGPAAKAAIGLGFLLPVPRKPGFFRTVERGIDLAKALDEALRADAQRYRNLLATLEPVTATEDDARAMGIVEPVGTQGRRTGRFPWRVF
jgi:hypothetical protein